MTIRALTSRAVPLMSLAAIGLVVGIFAGTAQPTAAPAPPPLPVGETSLGRDAVEASAVAVAHALEAVPRSAASAEPCPRDLLGVSWDEPGAEYRYGAYIAPIGPAPDATVTEVNGVVVCTGHPYAFMGFEAVHEQGRWSVFAVPYADAEHEENDDFELAAPAEPPTAPALPAEPTAPLSVAGGPIEGYALYDPQRICDPTAKPGAVSLRDLLLATYPGTRSSGITRACSIGGRSEHKEGRALDWGVHVNRPNERAAAEDFVAQLMATDAEGNRHALARRMGVMYVIWNRQIWTSYRSPDTWRPYSGASPHTDHVHISLSWPGARAETSFWSGTVDTSTLLAGTGEVGAPARSVTAGGGAVALVGSEPPPRRTGEKAGARAERHAAREAAGAARQVAKDEVREARHAALEAARAERREAAEIARQARQAAKEAAAEQRQVARDAERAARAEAKAKQAAEAKAAKEAARAARADAKAKQAAEAKAAKEAARAARADAKAKQAAEAKAAKEAAKQARRAARPTPAPTLPVTPPPSPPEPTAPPPEPTPPPPPEPTAPPPEPTAPPDDG